MEIDDVRAVAFLALRDEGYVRELSLPDLVQTREIYVGYQPLRLAGDPVAGRVFVALGGESKIAVINLGSWTREDWALSGTYALDIAVGRPGRVYAALANGQVAAIDAATGAVVGNLTLPGSGNLRLAVPQDGSALYVARKLGLVTTVWRIRAQTDALSLDGSIDLGGDSTGALPDMALGTGDMKLYVSGVTAGSIDVIDPVSLARSGKVTREATAISVSTDGRWLIAGSDASLGAVHLPSHQWVQGFEFESWPYSEYVGAVAVNRTGGLVLAAVTLPGDPDGNIIMAFEWTYVNGPPALTSMDPFDGSAIGTAAATLRFSAIDPEGVENGSVRITVDGVPQSFAWDGPSDIIAITSPLGEGMHEVEVQASDTSGVGPSILTSRFFTDLTPPVSSVNPLAHSIQAFQFKVTASASDSIAGVVTVELFCQAEGGPWSSAGNASREPDGTWAWEFYPERPGSYGCYSVATDSVGNVELKAPGPEASIAVSFPEPPPPPPPLAGVDMIGLLLLFLSLGLIACGLLALLPTKGTGRAITEAPTAFSPGPPTPADEAAQRQRAERMATALLRSAAAFYVCLVPVTLSITKHAAGGSSISWEELFSGAAAAGVLGVLVLLLLVPVVITVVVLVASWLIRGGGRPLAIGLLPFGVFSIVYSFLAVGFLGLVGAIGGSLTMAAAVILWTGARVSGPPRS